MNLVPSLRSRPSSQRMVYDPESLMHFTLASAKPSLAVRNQRSRMKSPTPLPLAFLLPTLLCQQKKAMWQQIVVPCCANVVPIKVHTRFQYHSISLFLCHLMFCKTIIKEWDRIGHRTEILAGYHVSSSWYRPSTLSPAWQSHWVWRCEICSAMFSDVQRCSWKPSVLTDASLTPCDVILWWAGQPCGWPSSPLATAGLPYLPSKSITKRAHRKLKLLLRTLEEPDVVKQLWGRASCSPNTSKFQALLNAYIYIWLQVTNHCQIQDFDVLAFPPCKIVV